MSDDLTFGVALKSTSDGSVNADVKSAREDVEALKKSTDELAAASAKAASQQAVTAEQLQQYWTGMSIAEDNAKAKAWALANGYQEVGGVMVKTAEDIAGGFDKTSFASNRAMQEMVVLGREAARGNWSRLPGTLSIIAQGLGPIGWAIAGVTAAVAAGAYAWHEWTSSADEAAAAAEKMSGDLLATSLKIEDQINLLHQRAALAAQGVTGQSDDETRQIVSLQLEIKKLNSEMADGVKIQQDGFFTSEKITQLQTALNRLLDDQKEKQAAINQLKEATSTRNNYADQEAALKKVYDDAQRYHKQMVESGKDGFTKQIDQWVAMQQEMTDAGIYYGKMREDHEADYTRIINAETDKRIAAGKKEADAKAAHLATQMASENAYFAQVAAATAKSDKNATTAENKRFADEMIIWQKRHEEAAAHHALSIDEENNFNMAKTAMAQQHAEIINQINKQSALADLQTLGEKSRVFFEISKQAAVAEIVMHGGERAEKAAAWASTWGGPVAAAAAEALSWAATAINVAKVESTQFGGGASVSSSGGVASYSAPSTTPAQPVSVQPPPTGVAAQTTQQNNYTIIGAKDNPDKPLLSYNTFVDIINGINKAGANGHRINSTVIAA